MAITKEVVYDDISVRGEFKEINCREATIIKEDGVELSRSYDRHVLYPDADISGEPQETQDICAVVWTDEVKAAYAASKNDGSRSI